MLASAAAVAAAVLACDNQAETTEGECLTEKVLQRCIEWQQKLIVGH